MYQQHFANPFKHDLSAATYFSFSSHVIPGVLVVCIITDIIYFNEITAII